MSSRGLPYRDAARPVMRLAFALAWLVGASLATALVVGVSAASPTAIGAADHGGAGHEDVSGSSPARVSAP